MKALTIPEIAQALWEVSSVPGGQKSPPPERRRTNPGPQPWSWIGSSPASAAWQKGGRSFAGPLPAISQTWYIPSFLLKLKQLYHTPFSSSTVFSKLKIVLIIISPIMPLLRLCICGHESAASERISDRGGGCDGIRWMFACQHDTMKLLTSFTKEREKPTWTSNKL